MAKKPKPKLTPIERVISLRTHQIEKMKMEAKRILLNAQRQVEVLEKIIANRVEILEALKRGQSQ